MLIKLYILTKVYSCTCDCSLNSVSLNRYLTEGCGVLLFTTLPLCVLGAWLSPNNWFRAPFWLAVWEVLFHSALSHKEHRFPFPIVPVGSVYADMHACI